MATKKTLTVNTILQEAFALANSDGIKSLSMRKLAAKLNVEAMSLYYYFKNKDQLLDAMVDEVFARISWQPDGENWQSDITQRANELRGLLKYNAWAVSLLDSRTQSGQATLAHHDAVLGVFFTSGFRPKLAAQAYAIIDSYIYGFVIQELQIPATESTGMEKAKENMISANAQTPLPNLTRLMDEYINQPEYDFSDSFDFGLQLILDGLEKQRLS